jgi:GntR family transcriptional repressor for pyruvate dehydrogenase complex
MNSLQNPIFNPLNREKLTELVSSQIKSFILSCGIQIGQKLPSERTLAEQLKVSRSVVREALRSLQYSGLIEIRRGQTGGSYVVDHLHKPLFNSTFNLIKSGKIDIQHFIEARREIECFGLRMAAEKIREEDINRLQAINEKIIRSHDAFSLMETNSLFHLTLSELSRNPLITLMVHSLLDLMAEMRFLHFKGSSLRKMVYKMHSNIIEAMRQKDWNRCELALAAHIDKISKELKLRKQRTTANLSVSTSSPEKRKVKRSYRRPR